MGGRVPVGQNAHPRRPREVVVSRLPVCTAAPLRWCPSGSLLDPYVACPSSAACHTVSHQKMQRSPARHWWIKMSTGKLLVEHVTG